MAYSLFSAKPSPAHRARVRRRVLLATNRATKAKRTPRVWARCLTRERKNASPVSEAVPCAILIRVDSSSSWPGRVAVSDAPVIAWMLRPSQR